MTIVGGIIVLILAVMLGAGPLAVVAALALLISAGAVSGA